MAFSLPTRRDATLTASDKRGTLLLDEWASVAMMWARLCLRSVVAVLRAQNPFSPVRLSADTWTTSSQGLRCLSNLKRYSGLLWIIAFFSGWPRTTKNPNETRARAKYSKPIGIWEWWN